VIGSERRFAKKYVRILNPIIKEIPIKIIFSCSSKIEILSKFRNIIVVIEIEIKVVDKTNTSNFFCKLKKVKEDIPVIFSNHHL
jgi:hypothetical protein